MPVAVDDCLVERSEISVGAPWVVMRSGGHYRASNLFTDHSESVRAAPADQTVSSRMLLLQ